MAARHIIRKQIIELEVPGVEQSWELQNRISELYRYELARVLDEVFSSIAGDDETLRIDRLEIDLGNIRPDMPAHEVGPQLKKMVEEQLSRLKHEARNGTTSAQPGDKPSRAQLVQHSREALLIHFLRTGTLPWWHPSGETRTIASIASALIAQRADWVRKKLAPLLRDPAIRRRMIAHLDDAAAEQLLAVFSASLAGNAAATWKACRAQPSESRKPRSRQPVHAFRASFWESALAFAVDGETRSLQQLAEQPEMRIAITRSLRKNSAVKAFIGATGIVLPDLPAKNRKTTRRKKGAQESEKEFAGTEELGDDEMPGDEIVPDDTDPAEEKNAADAAEQEIPGKKSTRKKTGKKLVRKKRRGGKDQEPGEANAIGNDTEAGALSPGKKQDADSQLPSANAQRNEPAPVGNAEDELDDEYEYETISSEDLSDFIVNNAGLVLLWPYLPPFFTELGLVKDRQFVDDAAKRRAVHLLQFVASGETGGYEEHELVLNKMLCGLGITDSLEMEVELTTTEKEEAENLLRAVITNWPAIGSTSVDGLRGAFLHKEGSLKRTDSGWSLYIERSTVDLLLDRLPWSISMIRLPWNSQFIYVEW